MINQFYSFSYFLDSISGTPLPPSTAYHPSSLTPLQLVNKCFSPDQGTWAVSLSMLLRIFSALPLLPSLMESYPVHVLGLGVVTCITYT